MKPFLNEHFLLENNFSQSYITTLQQVCPSLIIIITCRQMKLRRIKKFENITEGWLKGDHYKWRAMRANGIEEKFITGNEIDK